jgi:hypothetical protein
MARIAPRSATAVRARAALLLNRGRAPEAEAVLRTGCPDADGREACARDWLRVASTSGDASIIREAARFFVYTFCNSPETCSSAESQAGSALARVGDHRGALSHYKRAAERSPSRGAWLKVAHAAEAAELEVQAEDARRRALKYADRPATTP